MLLLRIKIKVNEWYPWYLVVAKPARPAVTANSAAATVESAAVEVGSIEDKTVEAAADEVVALEDTAVEAVTVEVIADEATPVEAARLKKLIIH